MNSYETIKNKIDEITGRMGYAMFNLDGKQLYVLAQPENIENGDLSTNIALMLYAAGAKASQSRADQDFAWSKFRNPRELAENLILQLKAELSNMVEDIKVAGPGFINFYLKDDVRTDEAEEIATNGILTPLLEEKALVEYTDPNCFKVFHIGHLMANAIGESLARIYETKGYEVTRVCYPSDIGRNVAMGVWGAMKKASEKPSEDAPLKDKVAFLGRCYAYANSEYDTNDEAKYDIIEVNRAIYDGTNPEIMAVYAEGRALSLAYFDSLYTKLGTTFDAFIYESEVSDPGLAIVKEYLAKGIFEESDGAIVYKGEQDGLHTRVFVNAQGLPTYEAKDLGNYEKKLELVPDASHYVVVTASEQNEYFKVINKVSEKIHPKLLGKLTHISHGMMRLPEGKMSSRTGNVIGGEDMLDMITERLKDKMADMRVDEGEKAELVNDIAVGAIKFSILKIAPGKDIAFDFDKSISFEGDSGPYLQYTHARLCALLDKAKDAGISFEHGYVVDEPERELERTLIAYHNALEKTYSDLGPHHTIQYLLLLTRVFNSLYARVQIVDESDKDKSSYYVMLAEATRRSLAHGLNILGIKAPERM